MSAASLSANAIEATMSQRTCAWDKYSPALEAKSLKGNYSSVHGKVFETTNDRKGYAKALGKPVLLIGICLLFSGVIAVILPKDYAISIAVIFILFIAVICSIWLYKIQKRFS